jgi:hypothetical protein
VSGKSWSQIDIAADPLPKTSVEMRRELRMEPLWSNPNPSLTSAFAVMSEVIAGASPISVDTLGKNPFNSLAAHRSVSREKQFGRLES